MRPGPLRVLVFCPYSLSVPGGVQGQAAGIARALSARRHAVLLTAPLDGHVALCVDGVEVVGVGRSLAVPANGSAAPVTLSPASFVRVRRTLARFRPDVVHVHEPLVPGPGLVALSWRDAPVVVTFHRAGLDVAYRMAGAVLRPLARRAAAAVAVSEEAAATARAVAGVRTEVLWNGVEVAPDPAVAAVRRDGGGGTGRALSTGGGGTGRARSQGEGGTGRARSAGGGGTGRARSQGGGILFVGRHERRKGLSTLIDAYGLLRAKAAAEGRTMPELRIAGDGPVSGEAHDAARDLAGVVWLGRIDDGRRQAEMEAAAVLVAPSLGGESFGVVLLEAMAAGAPVVASDLPGYRAVAGAAASLVRPGDAAALAAAIGDVLWARGAAARLVRAGAARVQRYSMDALAARYEAIFTAVVARVGRQAAR